MKPIRFFRHQDKVWYNLTDYTRVLLESRAIWPFRRSLPTKRRRPPTPILVLLQAKLNRLKPIYQRNVVDEVYVDGAAFEHFYLIVKPFLTEPSDWTNPDSLFRQLQLVINSTKRTSQFVNPATLDTYFDEIRLDQFKENSDTV